MRPISKSWVCEARALAGISAAVTVTMFAQLAISAIETLIIARLGVQELAGVTFALSIYLLFFLFALGVVTAVTPIVAAAYGRGDMEDLRLSGQQGFWIALTFSVPGVAILLACCGLAGFAIGPGVEADSAAGYLAGAAWGLPAWVSYVAVRCLAIATGKIRITTLIMLASVPVHAGLTWLLVFGGFGLPACGVFGAGLAYTLTALAALVMLAAIICRPRGISAACSAARSS
jgi:MATE family multidrug resistance protein